MNDIIIPVRSDHEWLADALARRPISREYSHIPEYAETTIIPEGPYRGNLYLNSRAPYMIEPLRLMSPQSSMQDVRLMWPAQSAKNTTAEMIVMYYIQEYPSEIMYAGSTMDTAKEWFEARIETRADKAGIEFRAKTSGFKSKRSGNRAFAKQFDGGSMFLGSLQSASSIASKTIRVLVVDEVDRVKKTIGNESIAWNVAYTRTQAWGDQRKVITISTPTTVEESMMNVLYLEGDQRLYHVPCPYCKDTQGSLQTLDLSEGRTHGLHWHTFSDGRVDKESICYVCHHCKREIPESKKHWMLQPENHSIWVPGSTAKSEFVASFNINGIYSPFISWLEMAVEYEGSRDDTEKRQIFENLKMGRPFKDTGSRPKLENVMELRGGYNQGTVPRGVLYLTMAIDVQRGSKKQKDKDGKLINPPRLEAEILGHGSGYRTWSIDYLRIEGEIDDPYSGAWEALNEWALDGVNPDGTLEWGTGNRAGMRYRRDDDQYGAGFDFPIMMVFIDAGNADDIDDQGEHLNTVFNFAERWPVNTFAIKGFGPLKQRKGESGDVVTKDNLKKYRPAKSGDYTYYQISTNYYKKHIYDKLKIPRTPGEWQKPGFCDFPAQYGEWYFSMLTAEEKRTDNSFHSHGRRNEAGDCRVYNLCAGEVWLNGYVKDLYAYWKEQGASSIHLHEIGSAYALQKLASETGQEMIPQRPPEVARTG